MTTRLNAACCSIRSERCAKERLVFEQVVFWLGLASGICATAALLVMFVIAMRSPRDEPPASGGRKRVR